MSDNEKSIELLRNKIDDIDDQVVKLLDERMGLAYDIGLLKAKENIEVFAENREKQIREHLSKAKTEHIDTEELFTLFEAIIKVGRQHGYRAKGL